MAIWVDVKANELLNEATTIAEERFGTEVVKNRPEIVAAVFQGLAALVQAKAMERLGDDICKAAAHARGE